MGKIRSKTIATGKALTDSQSYFIESMLSHNCIQRNVLSLHYFFLFTDGNTSATVTCRNLIMLMSYTEKTVFFIYELKKALKYINNFVNENPPGHTGDPWNI